jgi:PST family polysaccharide transporter
MLLGVAAFIQPVARTTFWLFSTQRRSRELVQWGLISGALAIISIVAGLPWGAVGVAAAYGFTDLCITTPLLFWFVCRKGPIRTADFYQTLTPSVCASLAVLLVLVLSHERLTIRSSLVGRLSISFGVTFVVAFLTFASLPAGRRAIYGFREIVGLLITGHKTEPAA